MKGSSILLLAICFLTASCALIQPKAPTARAFDNFSEDLSASRITFPDLEEQSKPVENVEYEIVPADDADLRIALDRLREANQGERYWSGFTVLVYSGIDRELAFETRNDLFTHFPDFKTDMQYQQPRYLVKVGKFVNRIEALAYYHEIKEKFPAARIIQDRFQREGYINPEKKKDDHTENQDISF